MTPSEFWRNFRLGEEVHVSGTFIYNGIRKFHDIQKLNFHDEMFDFLYELSVGLERLFKIAIVLYEYEDGIDQEKLEKSLVTHNHQELAARLQGSVNLNLGPVHNDFLNLLSRFYKSLRYDRFSLNSVYKGEKETGEVCDFLARHLNLDFNQENELYDLIGINNDDRYRKFIQRTTLNISKKLYKSIQSRARQLNLYTYELRYDSKAASVFLREIDVSSEDILRKELLLFFMNTIESTKYLEYLRGITPLEFDPALIEDYISCFKSDFSKASVMDELESHYEEMDREERKERLTLMASIGENRYFEDDDEGFDDEEEE